MGNKAPKGKRSSYIEDLIEREREKEERRNPRWLSEQAEKHLNSGNTDKAIAYGVLAIYYQLESMDDD